MSTFARVARASFLVLLGACVLTACSRSTRAGTTPTLTTVFVVPPADRTPRSVDLRHESTVGEHTVPGSLSEVWGVLPGIFEQLEIATTTIEPSDGLIGNTSFRARRIEGQRLSRFFDCGRSFGREYADQYAVTLAVMVQLVPVAEDRTAVRTILDAYARDPSTSSSSVHCITWGSLERRISDLVIERLGT